MSLIRQWWCVELMERFGIEGYASHHRKNQIFTLWGHCSLKDVIFHRHGQRFAYWTSEASSLLRGELAPVFRLPKSSGKPQPGTYAVIHRESTEYVTDAIISEVKIQFNFCHFSYIKSTSGRP